MQPHALCAARDARSFTHLLLDCSSRREVELGRRRVSAQDVI